MKQNHLIFTFSFLGLIFAILSVFFLTVNSSEENIVSRGGSSKTYTKNGNMGLGALSMGIISASCFIVVSSLIKKGNKI